MRRRCACSLIQNTAKKPAVKATPVIVATSLVSRLEIAAMASTRKISVIPTGKSNRADPDIERDLVLARLRAA